MSKEKKVGLSWVGFIMGTCAAFVLVSAFVVGKVMKSMGGRRVTLLAG